MGKVGKLIVILLVITGVIAAGVYFLRDDSGTTDNNNQATVVEGTTITYTNNGFSPMLMRMPAGTLTIKNESGRKMQFSSELHPSHTINPELNAPELDPGQTTTLTLTKTGEWNYHDHLEPTKTGTLTVE